MGPNKVSEELMGPQEAIEGPQQTTRRDAIKWGLAVLVGAGASALAPTQAYATVGDMRFGESNDAGADGTTLTSSANNGLLFPGASPDATLVLKNTYVTATGMLMKWGHALYAESASAGAAAIFECKGSGTGVDASSATGYGVSASGGKAPLRLAPASASGAPTAGSHQLGEIYADKDGKMWVCVAAGAPGTWAPILTGGGDASVAAVTAAGAATVKGATVLEGTLAMTRSGRKRISKGKASGSVTVPSGVATTANIICTLQNTAGSGVYVRYAKRTSATTFKIYLNKKATTKTAYVGWMILG